jgi:ATP/maltotriose-dependent transcriptional regulator MalT
VLRARLRSSDADEIATLHGRAAAWYDQQGMVLEALEHALAAEQIELAARLLERHGPTARTGYPRSGWSAAGALAEPGITQLEELLKTRVEHGRETSGLGARVLLARLNWQTGRHEQAITVLQPALALAEREEHTRSFVAAGPALIPALRQAAVQGIAPETVGRLLALLGESGTPPAGDRLGSPSGGIASPLAEPLSEREMEVLRLLAAGHANAEIAEQLFLAVGTVKRHVFNLYGKLGANSRMSAVARAHELGLL